MTDDEKPTPNLEQPELAEQNMPSGDARRPSDKLDKGTPGEETIPRKSSLL